jgi:16S rRNA processing protein RimM
LDAELLPGTLCELRFSDGQIKQLRLASLGGIPKNRLLFFEGVSNPEQARDLWGALIHIERGDLPPLPDNEFYADDLVGLKVVDKGRGDLGKVASIWKTGSNDCLEVQPPQGESFLLPMTDEVVDRVDLEAGIVTVALTPGLHPDDEA